MKEKIKGAQLCVPYKISPYDKGAITCNTDHVWWQETATVIEITSSKSEQPHPTRESELPGKDQKRLKHFTEAAHLKMGEV